MWLQLCGQIARVFDAFDASRARHSTMRWASNAFALSTAVASALSLPPPQAEGQYDQSSVCGTQMQRLDVQKVPYFAPMAPGQQQSGSALCYIIRNNCKQCSKRMFLYAYIIHSIYSDCIEDVGSMWRNSRHHLFKNYFFLQFDTTSAAWDLRKISASWVAIFGWAMKINWQLANENKEQTHMRRFSGAQEIHNFDVCHTSWRVVLYYQ